MRLKIKLIIKGLGNHSIHAIVTQNANDLPKIESLFLQFVCFHFTYVFQQILMCR
jgi:tRNA A22 N-methylase